MELQYVGKALIGIGLALIIIGGGVVLVARLGGIPRLPGDLIVQRPGFTLWVPLGTCILLSILLTLIGWAFAGFRR